MVKKNNNQSEALTYSNSKSRYKIKMQKPDSRFNTTNTRVWLAGIYSFEAVISIECAIIKQELQVTQ